MKKVMIILVILTIGIFTYSNKESNDLIIKENKIDNIDFKMQEEEYIDDVPFDTKEIVKSLNIE